MTSEFQNQVHRALLARARKAVRKGLQMIRKEYLAIMADHKAKPGNGRLIHGSDEEAIGMKDGIFKDGTGVWGIVGPKKMGGQPLAPQLIFGESGTNERWTKTGHYTGKMPTFHWLRSAQARANANGLAAVLAVLKNGN